MRAPISNPPGSTPPGSTVTTRSPGSKLWAPQTMPCGSPVPLASPTSTVHQLMVLPFFCGSGSLVSTRPITSGPVISRPGLSTASSLRPVRVSRSVISSVVVPGGTSTWSRIQDRDAFISVLPSQISVPNALLNRTSPSKSGRRSSRLWRNMNERSMPIPNAKPL